MILGLRNTQRISWSKRSPREELRLGLDHRGYIDDVTAIY